jgi:hypothetical protein
LKEGISKFAYENENRENSASKMENPLSYFDEEPATF